MALHDCRCLRIWHFIRQTVGYSALESEWYNELNDNMTISLNSTGMILGDYSSSSSSSVYIDVFYPNITDLQSIILLEQY